MPRFKVHPGAQVGHEGRVLEGGDIVDLPADVGNSLRHLMQEVDATGEPLVRPAVTSPFEAEMATAREHEYVTLIEREIAALEARLVDLRARLAALNPPAPATPPETKKPR